MKKTIFFLLQKVLGSKVLVFSVAFFFMGMASINAQYLNSEEAVIILQEEIQNLKSELQGATDEELVEIAFKFRYFTSVKYEINNGTEVGEAITSMRPTFKAVLTGPGTGVLSGDTPTFKQEANDLVAYTQNLLGE